MHHLLIDNSNTRTKFSIGTPSSMGSWMKRILTKELSPSRVSETLDAQTFDTVTLCSVVPEKAELFRTYFQGSKPFHQLCHTSDLGIHIDYPEPAQIGADRLANVVGVHTLYSSPAIVIDFGTAVTFDVIGKNATYLGGVISPGLASMTDNLSKRTALLPKITLTEPTSAIGKSTVEAMQAGATFGYRGMIKEIIYHLKSEMQDVPTVVATGGDAALIANGMQEIDHVDPTLTLEGIRSTALRTFEPK